MEIEDGVIWVYCVRKDGVQAFTDFGIENLIELVWMTKKIRHASSASSRNNPINLRPTPDAYYDSAALIRQTYNCQWLRNHDRRCFLYCRSFYSPNDKTAAMMQSVEDLHKAVSFVS
jgi:hypothetical protein